jgi:lysyl-tRNA synthetase class 2
MLPAYSNESKDRIKKINDLKAAWVIPYANKFSWKQDISEIRKQENKIKDVKELMENGAVGEFRTAWRIMLSRSMWKLIFMNIQDATDKIQLCFMKWKTKFNKWNWELVEELEIDGETKTAHKIAEKYLLVGDYVGVTWDLFVTKHWELTLFVKEFQILSKAVRPLPEKFHGVKDEELIYRQRYLDLIMNEDSYNRFLLRSKFLKVIREFYEKHWFIEIETPVLGNAASGAAAKPFITHHNDFDIDVYLRIAPEVNLKKATVGRFEKVFEISRNFRNEWSDPSHMQEFTAIEHYAAWRNYEDNMKFTEEMFDYIFEKLNLPKKMKIKDKEGNEKEIDWSTPWEKIDYIQWVKEKSGIDITKYTIDDEEKLREDIKKAGFSWEGMEKQWVTTLIDYLYKKVLRPSIVWPAFVYNYPATMQPLARSNDENPAIVEQFQVVVNGWEIIKAYSELVNPIEQKKKFDEQKKALEKWDEEATSGDDEFVLAMEYGMPPQSGWWMGVERILALLTGQDNLRDVFMFPLMKPLDSEENKSEK